MTSIKTEEAPASTETPETPEGEDDTELRDLENTTTDTVDEEWEQVLKTVLNDESKMHNKEAIMNLAYQHLIYEELDTLKDLRAKHERKEKLDDEEAASLSNAVVVQSYID